MERICLFCEIIEICLEMMCFGLNQGIVGNVSICFENGMLIIFSGIFYERMMENMIVYVDGNGKYEEGKIFFSEWCFYMVVY